MRKGSMIVCCFLVIASGPLYAGECQGISGKVKARADDGSALTLRVSTASPADCQKPGDLIPITVTDAALKTRVKDISPGDGVKVDLQAGANATASDLDWLPIPRGLPLAIVMPAALLFLGALAFYLSRNLRGLLLIGEDNRYSNSKTQATLWFFVTFAVYISAYFLRWYGGFTDHISIPQNLLLLSGMSALTAAAAKIVTTQKQQAAAAQNAPQKQDANAPSFPGDLVKADDGSFDLADYQMIVITLIAVTSYLVTAVGFLLQLQQRVAVSLPDIDGTMAALFGVGQGAYLTKKLGSDTSH